MTSPALPLTETVDPRYRDLDQWPAFAAVSAMWEAQIAAVAAVRPALPALSAAAEAAAERLSTSEAGRLIYCGAGTSGRLGVLDGSELPPTFDWPPARTCFLLAGGLSAITQAVENAEDHRDQAEADMLALLPCPDDVVIALAASGSTPYAVACARAARQAGALTIGIANSPNGALLEACEHRVLAETGAEPVAGSTRLKAGTAQKVILNLLSTQIMVLMGRVWRGHMVDMAARNEKLRKRALRMVMELTGAAEITAREALKQSNGKVKLAILLLNGHTQEQAAAALARAGGKLGAILG